VMNAVYMRSLVSEGLPSIDKELHLTMHSRCSWISIYLVRT
jgi:hypothetical protein